MGSNMSSESDSPEMVLDNHDYKDIGSDNPEDDDDNSNCDSEDDSQWELLSLSSIFSHFSPSISFPLILVYESRLSKLASLELDHLGAQMNTVCWMPPKSHGLFLQKSAHFLRQINPPPASHRHVN